MVVLFPVAEVAGEGDLVVVDVTGGLLEEKGEAVELPGKLEAKGGVVFGSDALVGALEEGGGVRPDGAR